MNHANKVKSWIKNNWFTLLIVLQPIFDIIAFFQEDNVIGSLAGYSRLLVMVVLPILVLFKTKKKKSFMALLSIIGAYCLLHIGNCFRIGYLNPFQDIAYLARVVQMPILTISFIYYFDDEQVKFNHVVPKAFYMNILIIFISMMIAHLTGTASWTYETYNVGLKGWFLNSNAQSIIIVTLVPCVLHYVLHLKNQIFLVVTTLFSWFMLISNGTKVDYYAIFIIYGGYALFVIIEYLIKRKDGKKLNILAIVLFIGCMVSSVVFYDKTPRYFVDDTAAIARKEDTEKMESDLSSVTSIEQKVTLADLLNDPETYAFIVEYYTPLINEDMVERFGIERVLTYYGYLPDAYQLADMRLKKQVYAELVWQECDPLTHFVGYEYSQMINQSDQGGTFDLENDYPAIYYYYGYLGFALYMFFLVYFVFRIIRKVLFDFKASFNSFNFALLLTFCIQLFAAQLSGAILRRPNVSIYLSIILMLIYFQTKDWKKKKVNENEEVFR